MSKPAPGYIHALFHTASDDGISVLLARRHLARTWSGGRSVRGEVPNWAGQWGLISARPMVTQPAEQSVQAAVLSQTGIDLSAPQSAERYRIVRTETRTFTDRTGTLTTALLLTCLPEGLAALAADAQANLNSRKVEDGVLALVEVHPLSSGLNQVAPLSEPTQGWLQLILEHGLASGQRVGAMAKALAERSAMTSNSRPNPTGSFDRFPRCCRKRTEKEILPPPSGGVVAVGYQSPQDPVRAASITAQG